MKNLEKQVYNRPIVLSIAGLDPSGGAGILADIKSFELNKTLGMAISTAQTSQTEDTFYSTTWNSIHDICKDISMLLNKYKFSGIKIGLVQNLEMLDSIIKTIRNLDQNICIVWDPILSATSGFTFHSEIKFESLVQILNQIDLITPNAHEFGILFQNKNVEDLDIEANILLKGGHRTDKKGTDSLYISSLKRWENIEGTPFKSKDYEKHGTGCILSSSITSQLAYEESILIACQKGKKYVESVMKSNVHLLGYHYL